MGNKTDRDDREVPADIGEEFAKQHDMYFLETSAKQADNVERLFYEIAAELIAQARSTQRQEGAQGTNGTGNGAAHSGGHISNLSATASQYLAQHNCCNGSTSTQDQHHEYLSSPASVGSFQEGSVPPTHSI